MFKTNELNVYDGDTIYISLNTQVYSINDTEGIYNIWHKYFPKNNIMIGLDDTTNTITVIHKNNNINNINVSLPF